MATASTTLAPVTPPGGHFNFAQHLIERNAAHPDRTRLHRRRHRQSGPTKTKAYVVLKSRHDVSEDELKAFVKERLAPYKYPQTIEFMAQPSKTATGKIQRFKLRELQGTAE